MTFDDYTMTAPSESKTTIEWGKRIDCALNGCATPCAEDGEVFMYGHRYADHLPIPPQRTVVRVNGHKAVVVSRTAMTTYGPWL